MLGMPFSKRFVKLSQMQAVASNSPPADYYEVSDNNLLSQPVVRNVAQILAAAPQDILDIGCGTGAFGTLLTESQNYTGIDLKITPTPIPFKCQARLLEHDACNALPFAAESFDTIVSFWCMEHLPAPQNTLNECVRVLKPGGWLFFVFPNYDNPTRRCPSWWVSHSSDDSIATAFQRFALTDLSTQLVRRLTYLLRQSAKQVYLDIFQSRSLFEINPDPAHRRLNWSRDRDAIHIASARSVMRYLQGFGLTAVPAELREEIYKKARYWMFDRNPEQVLWMEKAQ
ncbi:class I SAM-dependent methyltransferase [Rubinisphaera brasiliensis]|nr:class I SAM-dependent methyltransferase [Rubinisphaera brasiliensis]